MSKARRAELVGASIATGDAPSVDASGGGERCGARLKPTSDGKRRGPGSVDPAHRCLCAGLGYHGRRRASALRGTDGGAPGTTGDDSSPSESRRVVGVVPPLGGDVRGTRRRRGARTRLGRPRLAEALIARGRRASTSRSRFMRAAGYRGTESSAQTVRRRRGALSWYQILSTPHHGLFGVSRVIARRSCCQNSALAAGEGSPTLPRIGRPRARRKARRRARRRRCRRLGRRTARRRPSARWSSRCTTTIGG